MTISIASHDVCRWWPRPPPPNVGLAVTTGSFFFLLHFPSISTSAHDPQTMKQKRWPIVSPTLDQLLDWLKAFQIGPHLRVFFFSSVCSWPQFQPSLVTGGIRSWCRRALQQPRTGRRTRAVLLVFAFCRSYSVRNQRSEFSKILSSTISRRFCFSIVPHYDLWIST